MAIAARETANEASSAREAAPRRDVAITESAVGPWRAAAGSSLSGFTPNRPGRREAGWREIGQTWAALPAGIERATGPQHNG
ncbi:hypothetical protein ABZ307_14360 [Streptomyces griseorubiginosus]|uniref:hypothetical protein n=1 Tax=Streptomyces griseorubiginosus TaxID=67304 RepID=UPI0033BE1C73